MSNPITVRDTNRGATMSTQVYTARKTIDFQNSNYISIPFTFEGTFPTCAGYTSNAVTYLIEDFYSTPTTFVSTDSSTEFDSCRAGLDDSCFAVISNSEIRFSIHDSEFAGLNTFKITPVLVYTDTNNEQ